MFAWLALFTVVAEGEALVSGHTTILLEDKRSGSPLDSSSGSRVG